jgi:hypothetical protein
MNSQDRDYYIETVDTGTRPYPWRWELKRRSSPMGIKLGAGGYRSEAAALYAGKQALAEISQGLIERRTAQMNSGMMSAGAARQVS